MKNEVELQEYYAAGILAWLNMHGNVKNHFQPDDFTDWNYDYDSFDISDISANSKCYLDNKEILNSAIQLLIVYDLLVEHHDEFGPTVFKLTHPDALELLAAGGDETPFYKTHHFGIEWIEKALLNINIGQEFEINDGQEKHTGNSTLIAKDDIWQPLPIDREDPVFLTAIKAVEDALNTIEGDNGYAANEHEERNAIIEPAKGTLIALKEGSPSKDQIESNILKPFKYLAKKFADSAMGIAAKKAIEAIIPWLVSLF